MTTQKTHGIRGRGKGSQNQEGTEAIGKVDKMLDLSCWTATTLLCMGPPVSHFTSLGLVLSVESSHIYEVPFGSKNLSVEDQDWAEEAVLCSQFSVGTTGESEPPLHLCERKVLAWSP